MKKILSIFMIVSLMLIAIPLNNYVYADENQYQSIAVTGFTADLIADNTDGKSAETSTTVSFDVYGTGANNVMYSVDFRGPQNTDSEPPCGLPSNRVINSSQNPGVSYQLAAYNNNNALFLINKDETGTLELETSGAYEKIIVLASSASGASDFDVTLNFSDGSHVDTSFTAPDWFNGNGYAIKGIGRVARTGGYDLDGAFTGDSDNPRLYDCFIDNSAQKTKLLTSISVKKTSTTGRTAILAVAGQKSAGAPSTPVIKSATDIKGSSFDANWDAVAGATSYYLDVATDSSFTHLVAAYNNLDTGDDISYSVTGLDNNSTYYYRVRAVNASGVSFSSSTSSVMTISNDATIVSVLSKTITAGSEAGTSGDPKTASINVTSNVSTVSVADIVKHDTNATVTFYGTDSSFGTAENGSVNLAAGTKTAVYIIVSAEDGTEIYYIVTINRDITYTAIFDARGGSSVNAITGIIKGEKITEPTEPTQLGSIFKGWYKDLNCTDDWDFANDTMTENITLYALWAPVNSDIIPPNITAGIVNRTSDTTGTVKFSSDEAGQYYYAVVNDGATAPTIDTSGLGTRCTTSETTITNPSGLAAGAKDIYIKVIDAVGNVSNALKIDIAAYAAPSTPIYTGTGNNHSNVETITVDVKQGETDDNASKIVIERKTDQNGKKTDEVTFAENKAKETVENLKKNNKDTARIVLPDTSEDVSETKVTLPSQSINTLSESNINLQIDSEVAKIDVSKDEMKGISQSLEDDLYFRLVPIKDSVQKERAVNQAKLQATMVSGNVNSIVTIIGSPVTIETNMSSMEADITIPLSELNIPTNADEREALLKQLAVYIEHSDGDKELVQGELVEYRSGTYGVKFHIKKFSTFTVVKTDAFLSKTTSDSIKVKEGFFPLLLQAKGEATSQKLTFTAVPDVDGYILYGAPCGLDNHLVKITILSADKTTYQVKDLKKNTYYKYQIKAYKLIKGKKVITAVSKVVHSTTDSKKYCNPTKVTSTTSSVTMKVGESQIIKCVSILPKNKIVDAHVDEIRYESTNNKIATVDSNGKIIARAKETCYIYAYAQNGVYKKIKVTIN